MSCILSDWDLVQIFSIIQVATKNYSVFKMNKLNKKATNNEA